MRALIDAIEAEAFGPVRHILHIGIGGSALGPALLVDALGDAAAGRYDVAIGLQRRRRWRSRRRSRASIRRATLIAIASKTFTTTETLLNAALGAGLAGGGGRRRSLMAG